MIQNLSRRTAHLILICLLAFVLPITGATAQVNSSSTNESSGHGEKIYKSIGPNGEVIYSDHPSPGSKEISVPLSGGYKPVAPPAGFTPYQPPRPKHTATNNITITQPSNQATIRGTDGSLSVSVSLSKGLQPQQTLVYQIDGKMLYTGAATSQTFNGIFRGTHVLSVQLTNGDGSVVSSATSTFHMKRPFKHK